MKITATATMKGENEVMVKISPTFQGAENISGEAQVNARDSFRAAFSDSIAAGFSWVSENIAYIATVHATPEACAPIMAYAEKHGLEIIQM